MKEVVILSGKGGTGKTSVTAALATGLPGLVLADCDVDAADLHLVLAPEPRQVNEFTAGSVAEIDEDACTGCGLCIENCRFGALSIHPGGTAQLRHEHCEGCGVCAYVCPEGAAIMRPRLSGHWYVSDTRLGPMVHARLLPGEENSGKLVTSVRTAARELAESQGARVVLTDGPPGIGCPVIASLGGTDLALAVTEPTVSARHDLERLHSLTKHFDIPMAVIINKTGVSERITEEIRGWCMENGIEIAGLLPYDRAFTQAQIQRLTASEYDPQGLGAAIAPIRDWLDKALSAD